MYNIILLRTKMSVLIGFIVFLRNGLWLNSPTSAKREIIYLDRKVADVIILIGSVGFSDEIITSNTPSKTIKYSFIVRIFEFRMKRKKKFQISFT